MATVRTHRGKWTVGAAVALFFTASTLSFAAYEGFLEVAGIPGESTDAGHAGWIEILAYSHGIYTTATAGPSAQATNHQQLVIRKEIDKATPELNLACCKGQFIPSVILQLHLTTLGKPMFMEIRLENVRITAARPSGAATDTAMPTEEVKFTYSRIRWTYNRIDATGAIVETINTGWDVDTNTQLPSPSGTSPAVLNLK